MTLGMATASAVTIGRASCGAAVGGWTAAFSAVSKARVSSGSDDIIAARRLVLSAGGERMSSAQTWCVFTCGCRDRTGGGVVRGRFGGGAGTGGGEGLMARRRARARRPIAVCGGRATRRSYGAGARRIAARRRWSLRRLRAATQSPFRPGRGLLEVVVAQPEARFGMFGFFRPHGRRDGLGLTGTQRTRPRPVGDRDGAPRPATLRLGSGHAIKMIDEVAVIAAHELARRHRTPRKSSCSGPIHRGNGACSPVPRRKRTTRCGSEATGLPRPVGTPRGSGDGVALGAGCERVRRPPSSLGGGGAVECSSEWWWRRRSIALRSVGGESTAGGTSSPETKSERDRRAQLSREDAQPALLVRQPAAAVKRAGRVRARFDRLVRRASQGRRARAVDRRRRPRRGRRRARRTRRAPPAGRGVAHRGVPEHGPIEREARSAGTPSASSKRRPAASSTAVEPP